MTAAEWLRPSTAAERFGVSRQTLDRWAAKRWIGRSQPDGPGTAVLFRASDISALIQANETPREAVRPVTSDGTAVGANWEDSDFWRKGAAR